MLWAHSFLQFGTILLRLKGKEYVWNLVQVCTYLVNFHKMSSKFEANVALVLCFLDFTSFSCFPAFFFLEPDNFHLCLVVSPDCSHLCSAALLYKRSCLTLSGFGRCITCVPCPWYLHPVQVQVCNSVSVLFLFSVFQFSHFGFGYCSPVGTTFAELCQNKQICVSNTRVCLYLGPANKPSLDTGWMFLSTVLWCRNYNYLPEKSCKAE